MQITLQYFDGCPNWKVLDRRIHDLVDGDPDTTVTRQQVQTVQDAVRLAFHGSPTILIDGLDPFADGDAPIGLACRVFPTPAGLSGAPSKEQLQAAIASARASTAGARSPR